jgi:HNH endonuclease
MKSGKKFWNLKKINMNLKIGFKFKMKEVKRKHLNKKDILDYWANRVPESELNIDWVDGLKYCWGCGYESNRLENAHIIPHCLGGESIPSNMVILCHKCNKDNPHNLSVDDFWNWMKLQRKKNPDGSYNRMRVYEFLKEYEVTYGEKLIHQIKNLMVEKKLVFKEEFEKYKQENSKNYYLSNKSTSTIFFKNFVKYLESIETNILIVSSSPISKEEKEYQKKKFESELIPLF